MGVEANEGDDLTLTCVTMNANFYEHCLFLPETHIELFNFKVEWFRENKPIQINETRYQVVIFAD
jgi:hypothetical protein